MAGGSRRVDEDQQRVLVAVDADLDNPLDVTRSLSLVPQLPPAAGPEELNPNDAYTYDQYGWALLWAGRVDEAVAALEMALRLDSASPRTIWFHLGMAYYLNGRYADALDILEKGVTKRPDFVGQQIMLAATYARLGRNPEASRAAETVRRLDPFFEIASFGTAFRNPAHREAIVAGLREAGLK